MKLAYRMNELWAEANAKLVAELADVTKKSVEKVREVRELQ